MDGSTPIRRADALIPRPGNERRDRRPKKRFDPEALADGDVLPRPDAMPERAHGEKPVGAPLDDETGSSLDITA